MILTLLFCVVLIVSIIILKFTYSDILELIGFMGALMSIVFLLFGTVVIIDAHVGVDAQIYESQIQYESLMKRYEIVTSDYEDVSKSEVIKDIAEWNQDVYHEKYWGNNFWTNWFHDRDYVDSLQYIETEGGK